MLNKDANHAQNEINHYKQVQYIIHASSFSCYLAWGLATEDVAYIIQSTIYLILLHLIVSYYALYLSVT